MSHASYQEALLLVPNRYSTRDRLADVKKVRGTGAMVSKVLEEVRQ